MKKVALWIICGSALGLSGCASPEVGRVRVSPQVLQSLQAGVSMRQLEAIVGRAPQHQFTTLRRTGSIEQCISYDFKVGRPGQVGKPEHARSSGRVLLFIFTNDALEKVILPPRFPHEISPSRRGSRAMWHSHDPEHRIGVVRDAPALAREKFASTPQPRPKRRDPANPPNLGWPFAITVFPLVLPIIAVQSPVRIPLAIVQYHQKRADAQRFSGLRARLDMTVAEIQELYGRPIHVKQLTPEQELRVYGPKDLTDCFSLGHCPFHVAVIFENGKVSRLLSDKFLPRPELEHLQ